VTIIDGSVDFSGGVNSNAVTTIQSERNPNGLRRNQLAWADNATVRNGGITQRSGWNKIGSLPKGAVGLYQGGFMYEPDSENPYLILAIGGHIWKMDVDHPGSAVDLSAQFGVSFPVNLDRFYFAQAEQFLVIQAGDLTSLPMFWDGVVLRQSLGLTGMGLTIPPTGAGTICCAVGGGPLTPAVGGTITLPMLFESPVTPPVIGKHIFWLQGSKSQGQPPYDLITFSYIIASWQIMGFTPGVDITVKLLGFSAPYVIGILFPTTGVQLFYLKNEPSTFTPGTPEIPAASAMDYYRGYCW